VILLVVSTEEVVEWQEATRDVIRLLSPYAMGNTNGGEEERMYVIGGKARKKETTKKTKT
jgi:hypothetical protein